eukprot:2869783-Pleurochrysis_carterae.AAC.1
MKSETAEVCIRWTKMTGAFEAMQKTTAVQLKMRTRLTMVTMFSRMARTSHSASRRLNCGYVVTNFLLAAKVL